MYVCIKHEKSSVGLRAKQWKPTTIENIIEIHHSHFFHFYTIFTPHFNLNTFGNGDSANKFNFINFYRIILLEILLKKKSEFFSPTRKIWIHYKHISQPENITVCKKAFFNRHSIIRENGLCVEWKYYNGIVELNVFYVVHILCNAWRSKGFMAGDCARF